MQQPLLEIQPRELTAHGFMSRCFDPRVPALLKGAAAEWDFMSKWSVSDLTQRFADQPCATSADSRPARSAQQVSLQDYFAHHAKALSTFTYNAVSEKDAELPGMLRDIPLPNPLFGREDITGYAFFHANADDGTLPHVHKDAFNLLQTGRKHWVLFDAAPDTARAGWEALKACFRDYPQGSHARDWFGEGLAGLKRQAIVCYECLQEPGDIVYIPEYFSHAVLNLSEVMGLVVQRRRRPERRHQPNAMQEAFADIGREVRIDTRHGSPA